MSLLILFLLPTALHPGGGFGEEVTVLTEDSLKDTESLDHHLVFVLFEISSLPLVSKTSLNSRNVFR